MWWWAGGGGGEGAMGGRGGCGLGVEGGGEGDLHYRFALQIRKTRDAHS